MEDTARLYEMLHRITDESEAKAVALEGMRKDIAAGREEIAALAKILRDGNGRPALLERVATAESTVATLLRTVADLETKAAARGQEETRGRWALYAACASGIFSLITAIGMVLARVVQPH